MGGGAFASSRQFSRGFPGRFWGSGFRVQLSLGLTDLGGRKELADRGSSALASSTLVRIAPWGSVFRVLDSGLGLKLSLRVTAVCAREYMRAQARACWRDLHGSIGAHKPVNGQSLHQRGQHSPICLRCA